MRHLITTEMWRRLNLTYLRIRDLEIEDIWAVLPEDFYAGMLAETDAFAGAAASTMYRDEGWRFLQLGRFVERAQFSPALLLEQMAIDAQDGEYAEEDWTSLLRIFHGLEAYSRCHGAVVQAGAALDLLVTDPLLPSSLYRSLNEIAEALAELGLGPARTMASQPSGPRGDCLQPFSTIGRTTATAKRCCAKRSTNAANCTT